MRPLHPRGVLAQNCTHLIFVCLDVCLLHDTGWVQGKSIGDILKAGDSAISAGQYTSAVGLYSNAIRQDNASAVLFLKRAAAYVNLAHHGLALKDLGTAIQLDSKHLQGYLHRCTILATCAYSTSIQTIVPVMLHAAANDIMQRF